MIEGIIGLIVQFINKMQCNNGIDGRHQRKIDDVGHVHSSSSASPLTGVYM